MVDASVIIVNWNTSGILFQCLDSLYKAGTTRTMEVIVVDNGSTDDSVDMVEKCFPEVIVLKNNQNVGFARANNQAISISKGRYFLLLNSDTIMLPGCIDVLVDVADRYPEVGVVGPRVLYMDKSVQISWGAFPSLLSELVGRYFKTQRAVANVPHAYDVDWVLGACMLVRAETVKSAGPLDEDFFFYSEEVDWCYRIKERNWKVWYITNAEIFHLGGGSTHSGTLVQLVRLYRGKLLYFQKHHGSFKTTLLRLGLALANTLGILRRVMLFSWIYRNAAYQRIITQSKLVWCLLRNQYPKLD
jgi:GT2 family glycosyltransferase